MIATDAPLFVHSDVGRGLLAAKRTGFRPQAGALQASLVEFMAEQTGLGATGLIFPAFNYEYGATRIFDVDQAPVQVGAIPEWIRQQGAFHRSDTPFFSFLSAEPLGLEARKVISPFDHTSGFQWLVDHNAMIVLFGTPLSRTTFIHHVEEVSGQLLYRYDKDFPGTIIRGGVTQICEFRMHVRPSGVHLDYDWPRLEQDLQDAGILQVSMFSTDLKWINAGQLREFWGSQLSADPFYLLDQKSRDYFMIATDNGSRRIQREDYEDV